MILNEPLIRKVVEYIEQHPEEWNQAVFGVEYPPDLDFIIQPNGTTKAAREGEVWSRCGTTACFAGHALALGNGPVLTAYEEHDAADLLGLDPQQAHDIFHWYGNALHTDPKDKVQALKDRIEEVTGLRID